MNADTILIANQLARVANRRAEVVQLADSRWEFKMPDGARAGRPLWLHIVYEDGGVTVDDNGLLTALLYSLGQKEGDTPAIRLLKSLTAQHDMTLDYDNGRVRTRQCAADCVEEVLPMFVKVVQAMLVVAPHLQ